MAGADDVSIIAAWPPEGCFYEEALKRAPGWAEFERLPVPEAPYQGRRRDSWVLRRPVYEREPSSEGLRYNDALHAARASCDSWLRSHVAAGTLVAKAYGSERLDQEVILPPSMIWHLKFERRGRARDRQGSVFYHVRILAAGAVAAVPPAQPPVEFKTASDSMVRTEIKIVYDQARADGTKPPNINELARIVQPRLKAKGYDTSVERIRKTGDEPEFKKLRGKPGVRWSKRTKA
jgi:hypothetical protein